MISEDGRFGASLTIIRPGHRLRRSPIEFSYLFILSLAVRTGVDIQGVSCERMCRGRLQSDRVAQEVAHVTSSEGRG